MYKSDFLYIDSEIFGCVYDCPFQNRIHDCPYVEIEQLKFKEKFVWVNKLHKEEIELKVQHHRICSENRGHNRMV